MNMCAVVSVCVHMHARVHVFGSVHLYCRPGCFSSLYQGADLNSFVSSSK